VTDRLKKIYDFLDRLFGNSMPPAYTRNARQRIACTDIEFRVERHKDGKPHRVVRVRERQNYRDRSKYNGDGTLKPINPLLAEAA